jgi:DNA-binding response OmpR family regulator
MARILIAEGDDDTRRLAAVALVEAGHEVAAVADGGSVVERVLQDAPDVLVLDVTLPLMSGYAVLEELGAGAVESTKVLVVGAGGSEQSVERSFELGAAEHMVKPVDPDELVATVDAVLTLTGEQLAARREEERDRAHLLSQLESVFED